MIASTVDMLSRKLAWVIGAIVLTSAASCSTQSIHSQSAETHVRKVAAASRSRYTIFLIHGIYGNKTHFGAMVPALKRALPVMDENFEYDVVPFEYDTGNNRKDTYTFAVDFGNFVASYFSEHGAPSNGDKISLVMHSQGGIVGTIWLARAFSGDSAYHPEFAPYIDAMITLGTPFWGAKIATFASTMDKLTSFFSLPPMLPIGAKQLQEMSFGSKTIFAFRERVLSPEFRPVLEKMRTQVRPLNIGAMVRNLKGLNAFAIGQSEYEDDTAVPLPSARFDFIYTRDVRAGYSSDDTVKGETFDVTSLSRLIVVDGLHLSPVPEARDFPGIAQIPKRCIEDPKCDHPTYGLVLSHLLGRQVHGDESILEKMTGFILDLNVRLPSNHGLKPRDIRIDFDIEDSGWFSKSKLSVAEALELYSSNRGVSSSDDPNSHRFFFSGYSADSYIEPEHRLNTPDFSDRVLKFRVSAPGFKSRRVEARVRPTTTTFIDLNLEKIWTAL